MNKLKKNALILINFIFIISILGCSSNAIKAEVEESININNVLNDVMDIYSRNNLTDITQDYDLSILGWTDAGVSMFKLNVINDNKYEFIFTLPSTFDLLDYETVLSESEIFLNDILSLTVSNSNEILDDYKNQISKKINKNFEKSLKDKKDKIAFETENIYGDVSINTSLERKLDVPILVQTVKIKFNANSNKKIDEDKINEDKINEDEINEDEINEDLFDYTR